MADGRLRRGIPPRDGVRHGSRSIVSQASHATDGADGDLHRRGPRAEFGPLDGRVEQAHSAGETDNGSVLHVVGDPAGAPPIVR